MATRSRLKRKGSAKKTERLHKFLITPAGFAQTYVWNAKNKDRAIAEFTEFQKKNFIWNRDEWKEFIMNLNEGTIEKR